MKKVDVKTQILPHTQAKLDLFTGYLEHYLRVLCHASFCRQINLFDIYCGAGIYDDGKKGSPLLAMDCIRKIQEEIRANGKPVKPITLLVNDHDSQRIESVKSNVNAQGIEQCCVEYYNEDASDMLGFVTNRVSKCPSDHRNLVFIDPYGYSDITKDKMVGLLKNKYTEVILFLPVMQMYRFTETAFRDHGDPHYENLRKFITSFASGKTNFETVFEYIHFIKEALTINGTYLTCSYYIERGKGNYYALFFITSNIYGLEKMLETRWKLDPVKGKGFNQTDNSGQLTFLDDELDEIDYVRQISHLENTIYQSLKQKKGATNIDLYELTLKTEFLPKHANTALKNLIAEKKIREINNSTGFNINYQNYASNHVISKFEVL